MKIMNSYLDNAQWRMNYAKAMCITVYRIIDIQYMQAFNLGGGGTPLILYMRVSLPIMDSTS